MLVLAMAVFGAVSFSKLSVDLLPEISYPTLTVRTTWAGAAPADIEQFVSEPVQEALSTLPDLVRSSSVSRAGTSDVLLDFDWGTTMTFAVQDVREKLDSVTLPRGVERPIILRYDPNLDPILRIGVASAAPTGVPERDLVQLRWVAEDQLKRELEAIGGVAAVQVRGGLQEEIRVRLDPHAAAARGLDPAAIAARLAQENINASGGAVREGATEYLVRTLNEFRDLEEIEDLALVERGESVVRVRDVAEVLRTHARREVVTRIGGLEAVELAVYREAGANAVQVADAVKRRLFGTEEQQEKVEEKREREAEGEDPRRGGPHAEDREDTDFLSYRLRKEVELELLSDQSTFIRDAVDDVKSAAIVGSILAVLVILLFLRRLSATVIIGVSIPISVIVTFAPMYLVDVSLNVMSLGGLALGVGMLVDNAIVVLESISRCREEGDDLATAAVRGVHEVAGAVTASTLTTIAVFAPIVFVTGIAGQIFGDQALTVVTALAVSLVVAVLFIPMLASRPALAGERRPDRPARPPGILAGLLFDWAHVVPSVLILVGRSLLFAFGWAVRDEVWRGALLLRGAGLVGHPIARVFDRAWASLSATYDRLLAAALAAPAVVLLSSAGLLWLGWERVDDLGGELLPEIHQGEFTAFVKLPIGSPLVTTDGVLRELDAEVREVSGVETTALVVGVEPETLTREVEGPHTARLTVRIADERRGAASEEAIAESVRALISAHPAVQQVEIQRPTPFALDAPIEVEVKGYDLDEVGRVSGSILAALRKIPELDEVRTSLRQGFPEAIVRFDRDKCLEYGLEVATVAALVRDQVLGNVSTRFSQGEDRIDIRVVGDDEILSTLASVLELVVNPSSPRPVPLSAVASYRVVQGPAEIRRLGNSRGVVLTAEARELDLGGLSRRVEAAVRTVDVPEDVVVDLAGQKREMDTAGASMRNALLLAIFLVYVVMASQFESLSQPLIILLTIPLAGVGVVFALDALSMPLSVVVFIGLIMLAGIVVNNAIVLVDRINQKRDQGMPVLEAVHEAGRARLRPILMTTATTALGLLPLTGWLASVPLVGTLGSGEGAEMRAPMAVTVICGLVASTLLTLIVIPTVYTLLARLDHRERAA
jgi:HAE1 family hydrophobic/amphiphilic exporter-1